MARLDTVVLVKGRPKRKGVQSSAAGRRAAMDPTAVMAVLESLEVEALLDTVPTTKAGLLLMVSTGGK